MEIVSEKNIADVRKNIKYPRVYARWDECNKEYERTHDTNCLIEMDCIDHFYECKGYETYEQIAGICKREGFSRVFDIGCAIGHQSEIFLKQDLGYVGLDDCPWNYFNSNKFKYISKRYPCKIDEPIHNDTDVAISVLCLTWNCYLYDGENTLREQCDALKKDFKNVILYTSNDKVEFIKQYFNHFEIINSDKLATLILLRNR